MKERASFTFDKETLKLIENLSDSGKFRNKSHAVEEAIRILYNEIKKEVNSK